MSESVTESDFVLLDSSQFPSSNGVSNLQQTLGKGIRSFYIEQLPTVLLVYSAHPFPCVTHRDKCPAEAVTCDRALEPVYRKNTSTVL
jgi:hypothetical protein